MRRLFYIFSFLLPASNAFCSLFLNPIAFDFKYKNCRGNYKPIQSILLSQNPSQLTFNAKSPLLSARLSERAITQPELKVHKLIFEFIAGEFAGLTLAALTGGLLNSKEGTSEGFPEVSTSGTAGFLLGYGLGNALGVYLIGNSRGETGSFKATLAGSMIGLVVGFASLYVYDEWKPIPAAILLFGPPVGAMIGFNGTRRYCTESESEALLNTNRFARFSVGVPQFYVSAEKFNQTTHIKINYHLARIKF
jgi:hypothetical protein